MTSENHEESEHGLDLDVLTVYPTRSGLVGNNNQN